MRDRSYFLLSREHSNSIDNEKIGLLKYFAKNLEWLK
jgi:hypothetical protein